MRGKEAKNKIKCIRRQIAISMTVFMLAGNLAGCANESANSPDESSRTLTATEEGQNSESGAAQSTASANETTVNNEETTSEDSSAPADWEQTDADVLFSLPAGFYPKSIEVALKVKDESAAISAIYYTLDGSKPTTSSDQYTEPIKLKADSSDFPAAYCLRAIAVYEDGTESSVAAHTYFVNTKIDGRFTTLVFSVSGDPKDLTDSPDGIFYGENYYDRGSESEREVYVEAFTADGQQILGQFAGVRIYGGASRESSIKSMKLYARKSYDPENGKFRLDVFQTPSLNGKDEIVSKYKRLVLRNAGNDFQFAYLRDELNQTLAAKAGFTDYEAVVPAVGYLNGSYYGFYWLHENYCDDYFKEKYGDGTGEFIVIEGGDGYKDTSDEEEGVYAEEYQKLYQKFIKYDMTDDDNYKEVCDAIDVENYLDYFAFNIYLCNRDWPQNNYKCYRYYTGTGENYGDGVFDGRWRYLLHDIDYTLGLYDQKETKANYDTLGQVMDKNSERYSPLFTALMQREECKEYFVRKSVEYMNGTLSTAGILSTLEAMEEVRDTELEYYYDYLEKLRNNGDDSIWSRPGHLSEYIGQIENFAKSRPDYSVKYLTKNLGLGETYILTVDSDGIDAEIDGLTVSGAFTGTYYADYDVTIRISDTKAQILVNGSPVSQTEVVLTAEDITDGKIEVEIQ